MMAMEIDAALLLVMVVCSLILVCEDPALGFFSRAAISAAGALSFAQALWLLGVWVPSGTGYPWPRLSLDGAFALVAVTRAGAVLWDRHGRARLHSSKLLRS